VAGDSRIGESSKSIDKLKQDLRKNPQELSNYLRLALALYEEANYEEALTTLRNASAAFQDNYEVAYAMGLISKKMGNTNEAQKFFQDVIRLSEEIADQTRARMLRRFAVGHVNMIENGDWNLKGEVL